VDDLHSHFPKASSTFNQKPKITLDFRRNESPPPKPHNDEHPSKPASPELQSHSAVFLAAAPKSTVIVLTKLVWTVVSSASAQCFQLVLPILAATKPTHDECCPLELKAKSAATSTLWLRLHTFPEQNLKLFRAAALS
jgi:hypothetical protein